MFCSDYESTRDRLPVTRVLDRLALVRGLPRVLRADNALKFCGRAMLTWDHERRVTLRLIEPGKPNQTAFIGSFNGRFRDECLNVHLAAIVRGSQHSPIRTEGQTAGQDIPVQGSPIRCLPATPDLTRGVD